MRNDVLLDGGFFESFPSVGVQRGDFFRGQEESFGVFLPKAIEFDPKTSPIDFVHFLEVDPGDLDWKDSSVPGWIVEDMFIVGGSAKDRKSSQVLRNSIVGFADRDGLF